MGIIVDSYQFNANANLVAWYKEQEQGTTLPSGRRIYRHESGQGSVIVFDYWGKTQKLFVADAKYRALDLAYDKTVRSHGNPELVVSAEYFNGKGTTDSATSSLSYTRNDAWIQSTYDKLRNDGTAKSNTDSLMAYSTTSAAHHCRNQNIAGIGACDLPNLYELIILYLESDNIDALDPTVNSNRDRALGKLNTYGRFNFNRKLRTWSSTGYNSANAWRISYYGNASYDTQHNGFGVAPVKELST